MYMYVIVDRKMSYQLYLILYMIYESPWQYPLQSQEVGLPKQPSFVQALSSTKLGSHALTLVLN